MRVIYSKAEIQFLNPTTDFGNLIETAVDLSISFDYIHRARDYGFLFIPTIRYENENKKGKLTGSGTFRFKKGESDLADITYNPDFSDVDVDIQQFRLDRLPVNYPEKRPFFVEGRSYILTPVTLVRTRNILQPEYGFKFYSISDKSSFIGYYLKDTLYKDIGFGRFIYSPFKQTNFGLFFVVSQSQYNLFSADLTQYFESLKTRAQLQITKKLGMSSNLYYISIVRQVAQGFSAIFEFKDIGPNFIGPFNQIEINFDDIREFDGALAYLRYTQLSSKTLYFQPQIYYSTIIDKSTKLTLYETTNANFTFGIVPLFLSIGASRNKLNYLNMFDKMMRTIAVAFIYQISSWKSLTLSYTFGDYLGGKVKDIRAEVKFPLLKILNFGFSGYKIKTSVKITPSYIIDLDDLTALQFFGEIQFFKYALFKPYVLYEIDNLKKNKKLTINGIFIFEPKARYLTGFYIAFNRKFSGYDKLTKFYNKEVVKLQVGFKI